MKFPAETVEQLTLPLFETSLGVPRSIVAVPDSLDRIDDDPPVFEPPTFEAIIHAEGIHNLRVSPSRRLKRSWNVTRDPFTRHLTLSIPSVYENAPAEIKQALVAWSTLAFKSRRNPVVRQARRLHEKTILSYATDEGISPRRAVRTDSSRFDSQTAGVLYNLRDVFEAINLRHFDGKVGSRVRWGGFASTTSYQCMKTDLAGNPFSLITIAGVYNHPNVPLYAIEAVMYHEMLHVALPPTVKNGRRVIHPREFRVAERRFPDFDRWHSWEHTWLHRLAREMRRRRGKNRLSVR